jgi:hypothetical protein
MRMPEDEHAFDAKTDKKVLRGHRERCQNPDEVILEQLESTRLAPYEYRPLDRSRQEIRLLTIEPGSGSDMVRCTLKHAFLDTTPLPDYETTSYVCGDPAIKSTIILHGHEVQAMATSEAVLRRMRLRDISRTVWIDSICIDQNDTGERGHQVGMMYQVYTKTWRNLIWLGPADGTLAESINAMEAILREIALETRNYADFQETVYDMKNLVGRFSDIPLLNTADYVAFLRLVDNLWFSRLWIVQEASLAPLSICHYGEFKISLIKILRAAEWLNHKWYQLPEIPLTARRALRNAGQIADYVDQEYGFYYMSIGVVPVMVNLLRHFGQLQTYDRRDRVFAILGLWQIFTKAATLPDILRPNYNLSVGEVTRNSIRYAIEDCNDLRVLEWISEPSPKPRDASWSSWVPDLDLDRKDEPRSAILGFFDATNDATMILEKDAKRPNDLVVSGVLLDSVAEVHPAFKPRMTPSGTPGYMTDMSVDDMFNLVADLERPRGKQSWVETPAGGLETIIALVLLGGHFRGTRIIHQAVNGFRDFGAYLDKYEEFPGRLWDFENSESDENLSAREFWNEAWTNVCYRALYHTTTGHMGLGPRCTQPGDVVAILYGSRYPIVLRPASGLPKGTYRLLGTSYVYGIMDGEAVRRHKEMGLEDDVFRIV